MQSHICLIGKHRILDSWNILLVHYTCSSTIACNWILRYIVWSIISNRAVLTSLPFRWQKSGHLWATWGGGGQWREKKGEREQDEVRWQQMQWKRTRSHASHCQNGRIRVLWGEHKQRNESEKQEGGWEKGTDTKHGDRWRQHLLIPWNAIWCNSPREVWPHHTVLQKTAAWTLYKVAKLFSDVVPTNNTRNWNSTPPLKLPFENFVRFCHRSIYTHNTV